MGYREGIKFVSEITAIAGITGIAYTTINANYLARTNPTPLVDQYNKHENRLRVLARKQYLENLTQEEENIQKAKHRIAMIYLEHNPDYDTQKFIRKSIDEKINKDKPVFFISLGLLALSGAGYAASKPRKEPYQLPYKLEDPF